MFQIKGQHKTPEKELNEMKTSNLADKEIKTIVIKMLNKLRRNIRDELRMSLRTTSTSLRLCFHHSEHESFPIVKHFLWDCRSVAILKKKKKNAA